VTTSIAKQNEYEEGNNLDPDTFMTQANNKYKSLLQSQTWNAPSPELQKIMTMEATIKQLKKKGKSNSNNKSKGNNGKGKNKKGKKGDKDKFPSWMSKEPPKKGFLQEWYLDLLTMNTIIPADDYLDDGLKQPMCTDHSSASSTSDNQYWNTANIAMANDAEVLNTSQPSVKYSNHSVVQSTNDN